MSGMDGFITFNGTLQGGIEGGGGGDVTDVKVRNSQESDFESVVNEEGVAEIDLISYVRRNELTQSIQTVVDNIELLIDTKQNLLNYSTEEQPTGNRWIDGKMIYQKTFEKTVSVTGTSRVWYTVISSSELRDIDADKIFIDSSGSYVEDSDAIYSVNYSTIVGSVGGVLCAIYDKTTDEIQFLIGGINTGTKTVKLTIRYTKTTD